MYSRFTSQYLCISWLSSKGKAIAASSIVQIGLPLDNGRWSQMPKQSWRYSGGRIRWASAGSEWPKCQDTLQVGYNLGLRWPRECLPAGKELKKLEWPDLEQALYNNDAACWHCETPMYSDTAMWTHFWCGRSGQKTSKVLEGAHLTFYLLHFRVNKMRLTALHNSDSSPARLLSSAT